MLNTEQQRAVEFNGQYLQIIAGPGTGKTLTLASRIERLIENGELLPERVLALTFTNNAVQELKIRLSNKFGDEKASLMKVMTYHAFSTYLISLNPSVVGLNPLQWGSADEWDQQVILLSLRGLGSNARSRLNKLRYIRRAINSGQAVYSGQMKALESYKNVLQSLQMVDYDTMLEMGSKIIAEIDDEQLNIDHIFLDEFQDSSPLQWELVNALVKKNSSRKLTVVGDPNQEIYGFMNEWHSSSFSVMDKDFPNSQKVRLDTSYRSNQEICDLTAEMISGEAEKEEETSLTSVKGYTGDIPTIQLHDSTQAEYESLVANVKSYLLNNRPDNIGILVRTNVDLDTVAKLFIEAGIPVDTFLNRSVLANPYVRLVYCLYKHVTQPSDVYLLHLLTSQKSTIFNTSQSTILKSYLGQTDIMAAAGLVAARSRTHKQVEQKVREVDIYLKSSLETLRATRDVQTVISESNDLLKQISSDVVQSPPELESFYDWIERSSLNKSSSDEPLVPWIVKEIRNPRSSARGSISIHTVHSAKGLEWDAVFMPRVEPGVYPLYFNSETLPDRKVLYVGMTRAKKTLALSATRVESTFLSGCKTLVRKGIKPQSEGDLRSRYPKLFGPLPYLSKSHVSSMIKKLHL
ncbi:ATP-dependent DNA helicase PcrA [Wickerhamiella sorbophila]|uniref:DNA 3'-5' helicase n=1 Tax=Wickerhamiella sorbophila TaxID=45607 RepID=A0A2T0FJA6_9ASCO|nr:ATP-dependent DNA helicase PcrA [Wickerhamiella sorbophila]PRT55081.1 ATP-dependent DNA helicase PcrA [Wickerhamiella sorbophila]